jgi:hypothetical protein
VSAIRATDRLSGAAAIDIALEWPCLARALIGGRAAWDVVQLTVRLALRGSGERLAGTLTATVLDRGVAEATPRLSARVRGSIQRVGPWVALELHSPAANLDLVVHGDDLERGSVARSTYICTDLLERLGLAGGQYGTSKVQLRLLQSGTRRRGGARDSTNAAVPGEGRC